MNIFDPDYVAQAQVDSLNTQAQVVYDSEVAQFRQQEAQYQTNAQREWDINHRVLTPPAVPLLKTYQLIGGIPTQGPAVNKLGLTAPVFKPETPRGGNAIAANAGPSNSDLLAVIYQQNIALNSKLDQILKVVAK